MAAERGMVGKGLAHWNCNINRQVSEKPFVHDLRPLDYVIHPILTTALGCSSVATACPVEKLTQISCKVKDVNIQSSNQPPVSS